MRILAIRGRNLASLAGDFEVDFRSEPLASAGVFAISGPTGAGKSTLLDAMCLALYHDTPRLRSAKEAAIAIPDVKDQTLTPQDPRHLLRRGCGEGHAEVDFEDQAGVEWRARWSVARARGRVGGRLQQAQVSLLRIADDQPEGGSVRELQERLAQLTGLSFEQFCRSVLLAQNDFAALLKARQEERAGLLEALTGTAIFSQLSKLAHQRNSQEQQQLRALEAELGAQPPLDDAARQALEQAQALAAEQREQLAAQMQSLELEAAWHAQGAELAQRQAHSEMRVQELADALQRDSALEQQLRLWAAADALRLLANNAQGTDAEATEQRASLPALQQAATEAIAALTLAKEETIKADAALVQAISTHDQAQPQILAARAADTQIELARSTLRQAGSACERANADAIRLTEEIKQTQQQRDQQHQAIAVHAQWQQAHPRLSDTGPEWAALGHRLRVLSQARQRQIEGRARREQLQRALALDELALTAAAERSAEAQILLQQSIEHMQQAEQSLAALDAPALAQRQRRWLQQNRNASALALLCESHSQALSQYAALEQRGRLLAEQADTAKAELTVFEAALVSASKEETDAESAFRRASLVADAHTEQLRSLLVDGEPCPVCGAREHPHADQADSDLSRVLAALAAQAQAARETQRKAMGAVERGRSTLDGLRQRLIESGQEHDSARATLAELETRLLAAAASLLPQIAQADAVAAALAALQLQLDAEQRALERDQAQLDQAQQARDAARKQQETADRAHRQAQTQAEQLNQQLQPQLQTLLLLEGELGALARDIEFDLTLLRQSPPRAACDIDQIPELRAQWDEGEQLRALAQEAEQQLRTIDSTLASLQSQALTAESTRMQAEQSLQQAEANLQRCLAQRGELLAETDTEAHAKALDQAVAQTRLQRDRCSAFEQQRSEDARSAEQSVTSAEQQLALLQTRHQQHLAQLQQEWRERLLAAELDQRPLADLWTLLRDLPADLGAQQQAWRAREQALTAARAESESLSLKRREWQQQAASSREAAVVTEQLRVTREARDQALQQLGALEQQLSEDNARRATAADRLAELQIRREQAQRWVILDQLIGAADGSKFKRYAQQFTLEVLLEYANQHLSRLSPRYRLRRGNEALSLLIIDHDLGDELRTVHSLSGGETFLVSLALALGLASLSSQRVRVESLFIDEGFGSLDAATLNTAMEALDRLQAEGRRVGVISHVHDMAERIGVQIRVEPVAPGRSRLRVFEGAEAL